MSIGRRGTLELEAGAASGRAWKLLRESARRRIDRARVDHLPPDAKRIIEDLFREQQAGMTLA